MSLLNYTTQIDAFKTISEIQQVLARVGASAVMTEMDNNGYITSLSFRIKLDEQNISFRLPTDWRPVLQVMNKDPKVPGRLCTQEQALRVAWRMTKNWVEAQAAFIETMMVTTAQVFLPYAVTSNGQSLYEQIASDPSLLLTDGTQSTNPDKGDSK